MQEYISFDSDNELYTPQIVRALEGDASDGIRLGDSTVYTSHGGLEYDAAKNKEHMTKFRKMVFATMQSGSSEVSGPTSEYGLKPSDSSSGESQRHQTTREMEMRKMNNSQGFSGSS